VIDLEGTYTQFMMFTPLPVTRLYQEYKAKGLIDFELPFEEWHGQKYLNYQHAHFSREEASAVLNQAFEAEFDQLSSSAYRMLDTALRGFLTLERAGTADPWLQRRASEMRSVASDLRLLLPTLRRFAHNTLERQRVREVAERCDRILGPLSLAERVKQLAARVIAEVYAVRCRVFGDRIQPETHLQRFRWETAHAEQPTSRPASRRRLHVLEAVPETSQA